MRFILSLQTWTWSVLFVFCLQQHLLFDELCVLCAWFHLIISHSILRFAQLTFESLNWWACLSVWVHGIPFIQCHHQFLESFTNILLYCSISSAHCKQFYIRKWLCRCLFSQQFSFYHFAGLFLLLFWVRFAKVRQLSLENVSVDSHTHIILRSVCPCFVLHGSVR